MSSSKYAQDLTGKNFHFERFSLSHQSKTIRFMWLCIFSPTLCVIDPRQEHPPSSPHLDHLLLLHLFQHVGNRWQHGEREAERGEVPVEFICKSNRLILGTVTDALRSTIKLPPQTTLQSYRHTIHIVLHCSVAKIRDCFDYLSMLFFFNTLTHYSLSHQAVNTYDNKRQYDTYLEMAEADWTIARQERNHPSARRAIDIGMREREGENRRKWCGGRLLKTKNHNQ